MRFGKVRLERQYRRDQLIQLEPWFQHGPVDKPGMYADVLPLAGENIGQHFFCKRSVRTQDRWERPQERISIPISGADIIARGAACCTDQFLGIECPAGRIKQAEELVDVVDLRQLCRRKLHGALVQPVCCFPIQPIPAAAKLLFRAGRSGDFFKAKTPENRERFFLPSFGVELTGNLIGNAVLRLRPFTFACTVCHRSKREYRETDAVIHDKAAVPRALINVRLTGQFFILVDAMNTFTP